MKRLLKLRVAVGLALLGCTAEVRAQTLIDQAASLYDTNSQRGINWQSQRGVPISSVVGTPPGSDGRNSMAPSAPTPNQFRGIITYAAVASKNNLTATPSRTTLAANADALN